MRSCKEIVLHVRIDIFSPNHVADHTIRNYPSKLIHDYQATERRERLDRFPVPTLSGHHHLQKQPQSTHNLPTQNKQLIPMYNRISTIMMSHENPDMLGSQIGENHWHQHDLGWR